MPAITSAWDSLQSEASASGTLKRLHFLLTFSFDAAGWTNPPRASWSGALPNGICTTRSRSGPFPTHGWSWSTGNLLIILLQLHSRETGRMSCAEPFHWHRTHGPSPWIRSEYNCRYSALLQRHLLRLLPSRWQLMIVFWQKFLHLKICSPLSTWPPGCQLVVASLWLARNILLNNMTKIWHFHIFSCCPHSSLPFTPNWSRNEEVIAIFYLQIPIGCLLHPQKICKFLNKNLCDFLCHHLRMKQSRRTSHE